MQDDDEEMAFGERDSYLDSTVRMEEGVPLLPERKSQKRKTAADNMRMLQEEFKSRGIKEGTTKVLRDTVSSKSVKSFDTAHNEKMLFYDHDSLLTTKVLSTLAMSVLSRKPVIMTLFYVWSLAICSAFLIMHIPKAYKFESSKFNQFENFIKFFIAFMLGTFVTQSFKRWWTSVSSFEKILIDIQKLVFMLHTIRARPLWRKMVEQYCVASCYILNVEIRNAHVLDNKKKEQSMDDILKWLAKNGFLSADDLSALAACSSSSICAKTRAIWNWIGEMVGSPFVDEGFTVMAPLLVRTLTLAHDCVHTCEVLKMNVSMQTPFMYVSLLSILVHANNTIMAVNCGMAIGSAIEEIRHRHDHQGNLSAISQLYQAVQVVGFQILVLFVGPLLYVAFLHMAHMLSYPFGEDTYHLPTETHIATMQADLHWMAEERRFLKDKHAEWKKVGVKRQFTKDNKGKKDMEDDDDEDADDGGD